MTIDLSAAEKISGLTVFGLGIGLVFIGLVCIIIICSIMGFICKKVIHEKPAAAPSVGAQSASIKNKGEFIAAVSAAIAEDMGTDISAIRILSVKKL